MRIKRSIPAWKSVPQLGRIAKGIKGENHPEDLDYFIVEFNPEYEYLRPAFEELYGKQPKEFNGVFLVGKTPDEALSTRNEHWGGNETCKILCDGETIYKRTDDKGIVNFDRVPCYFARSGYCYTEFNKKKNKDEDKRCSSVARFSVIMRDLFVKTGVLGAFKIATQSNNDIDMLTATIDNTFDRISRMYHIPIEDIPFTLGRRPQSVQVTDDNGKHINRKFSLLYISINMHELQQQGQLEQGEQYDQLPAGTYDENGEAIMSLDEFLRQVKSTNLVLSADLFASETKKLGYASKEQIGAALQSKKSPYTIDKNEPCTYTIALGYLMLYKDVPNPWASAINAVAAAYADIPWE